MRVSRPCWSGLFSRLARRRSPRADPPPQAERAWPHFGASPALAFDDLAAFQRTYLENQYRLSQLTEDTPGVEGEKHCDACPSRVEVTWSPLWGAHLCVGCRYERTEDELRETRGSLGLAEPIVVDVEMHIELDTSEFLREIRDMRDLVLTLPDRRLEITGTFTDGAGNPLTATITGELMGLNDDAAPGD